MDLITRANFMGAAGASTGETLGSTTIGASSNGGFFAGYISHTEDGNATHALIVGPASIGYGSTYGDGNVALASTNAITTATSEYDGVSNTAILIANLTGGGVSYIDGLSHAGFSDWYIPAIYELEIAYYNLKPSGDSNYGYGTEGANSYAVPTRSSAYAQYTPGQTSVTAFQDGGSEAFNANELQFTHYYWSSTQDSSSAGDHRYLGMVNGYKSYYTRSYAGNPTYGSISLRPFRRITL